MSEEKSQKPPGKFKQWLSRLSPRVGVILLIICVLCYTISFGQMLLPIDPKLKGVLWVVFFGLAKPFQYAGLAIVGVAEVKRWKQRKKKSKSESGNAAEGH